MNFFKSLITRFAGKAPASYDYINHPKATPSPWGEGRGEGELNSKFKTENSTLNLTSNRNGKIARLPRHLRDRLNQALYDRYTAKSLCHALNQLPEVKALMAQYFDGRPLRPQNLSEWKQGGYRDWLRHRELLEQKRELNADAKDLSDTAHGLAGSLFGLLTLDYTDLLMHGDTQTPGEFEARRKKLSLVSQDIARLHRCDLHARRVQVQEAKSQRDEEKTEEQLLLKFVEWTDNPAVRRACILAPMEQARQMRKNFGMPPAPEDPWVEAQVNQDSYFHPEGKNPAKNRPHPAKKSNPAKPSSSNETGLPSIVADAPVGTRCCTSAIPKTKLPAHETRLTSEVIAEIEAKCASQSSPAPVKTVPTRRCSVQRDEPQAAPSASLGGASVPASRSPLAKPASRPNPLDAFSEPVHYSPPHLSFRPPPEFNCLG
jgi:hypothetical protein